MVERGGKTYISTAPRDVYDVTGAGDVVFSTFGLFVIAGLGFSSAARLANLAASIEVTRLGTDMISREDISRALIPQNEHLSARSVNERTQFRPRPRSPRRQDHRLHQWMLRPDSRRAICSCSTSRARRAISWWSASTAIAACADQRTGASHRPASDRSRILAALEPVDYVIISRSARRANHPHGAAGHTGQGRGLARQGVDGQKYVES